MRCFFNFAQGKNLDSQPVEHAVARPVNMTAAELGPTLSQFCEGVPAVWYDVTSKSGELAHMETVVCMVVGMM